MKTEPIVVIGGGFGGLRAALDLDRRLGHELHVPIFLLDASPFHIYTPSLYEVASSPEPKVAAIPFEEILEGTNIRFIQERVTSIDPEAKQVLTEKHRLRYSDLVLALGSQSRPLKHKSNSQEEFLSCQTLDEVLAVRQRLADCFARSAQLRGTECHSHIIVVGGGVTGVEFAAGLKQYVHDMAEFYGVSAQGVHITLVEAAKDLLPSLPKPASAKVKSYLQSLGITLRLHTTMTWRGSKQLMMNKSLLPAKTVVWTVGNQPHPLVQSIKGLRHDENGRVLVDASLQALGQEHLWIVGDAAAVIGSGTADAAIAQGRYVAQTLGAKRLGEATPAYRPELSSIQIGLSSTYGLSIRAEHVTDGVQVVWNKKFSALRYYLSILPFTQAYTLWRSGGKKLSETQSTCVTWSKRHKAAH